MNETESPRGLTGTVVRGVSFAGGGFLLARGITFAAYVALARLVTPTELGQFTAGTILIAIGFLFAESGMAAAVIHRRDRLEEAAATAVVATVLIGITTALLNLAASPLLGSFFDDSATVAAVAAATSGVLFLGSARVVPNALLQRRFSFLRRIVVEPASALAFAVGAIIATSEGMGVWGLVVGQYASAVTDFILSWGLVRWRPKARLVSFGMWRELVAYARHVLVGTAIRRIGNRIPLAAAGGFVSAAALGQFQYATRVVGVPFAFLVSGISYVVFPAFARISHDARRFEPAFMRSFRWTMLAAAPIGMILLVLGEPFAVLVFGERWEQAGEATRALALFVPAQMVAQMIGEAFKGTGHPVERTWVNAIGVLAGVIAMAALIPPFGLIGVAVGVSVDALAGAISSVRRAHRAMGIPMRPMLAAIAAPLLATAPMVGVVLPLDTLLVDAGDRGTAAGLALLVGEGLAGLAIYAAAVRALSPGVTGELAALLRTGRRGGGQPSPVAWDA
ncbi:MAG: oligosaccharide flippase family protein [Solirubrobacterales bacterium]